MKVLNKLVIRNFFLNKKRTIVTIVGIMLSTALITAVANMAESFRGSMIEYEKIYSGDFHYAFYDVKQENYKYFENNRNIKSLGYIHSIGYSLLEGSENDDKPYLYIRAMDEAGMRAAGVHLTSGRLPQNDRELVISKHIQTNGGVSYKIGDKLILSVGERIIIGEVSGDDAKLDQSNPYTHENEKLVPEQNIEYTVVGIMDRPNRHIEQYTAPGYTVVTMLSDKTAYDKLDIFATYTKSALKERNKVTAELFGISEKDYKRYMRGSIDENTMKQMDSVASYHVCNEWLLKWQMMDFSDSTKTMLYSVAAVLIIIIIFTSVFCIRNSFVISLTEKMKLYGMMSSIGATKKQRRKLVRGEAFLLGCIGIPLGIICGALATFIVVKCTNGLMENATGINLVYTFSVPAMIAGVLLSVVTIYFSSGGAARRAAKVSPIVAIRGNDTVKIKPNELRTPKLCQRLFGIGGTIAYKNLRRAKVKYRTTVVSIVVSAAVFIAMTTFTQIGFKVSLMYYEDVSYQLRYVLYAQDYREDMWITQLEGVDGCTILRRGDILVNNVLYNKKYMERSGVQPEASDGTFQIAAIGDSKYRDYCNKLGLSYDKVKDKGILVDDYLDTDGSGKRISGVKYEYKPGDIITGYDMNTMGYDDESDEKSGTSALEDNAGVSDDNSKKPVGISIEIAARTDIHPMGLENTGKGIGSSGLIIVSDEWFDRPEHAISPYRDIEFLIQCDNPDEIQKEIESRTISRNYYLNNMQESYERDRSSILLVSVFLYGFIIVISLIGITNVFNTITTNMELRQRDFAMLKSIGMTKKEFRRMIWLESVFYGTKALLIGIPLGIALSVWLYKAFLSGIEISYQLPYSGIIISIVAVFILLFVTTQYSMNKINKKNIVDTIQNENI